MEYTDLIRVGRDSECEVRVTDISVSRFHAYIKRNDKGTFSLFDNNSKFGTLALLKQPLFIEKNKLYYMQCGRSLLEINLKKNSIYSNMCSCLKKTKNTILPLNSPMEKYPCEFMNPEMKKQLKDYQIKQKIQKGFSLGALKQAPLQFN